MAGNQRNQNKLTLMVVAPSVARRWPGSSRAVWPRRWTAGSTPSTPTLPAERARRHRARRAAHPSLLPDRGSEGLRKACPGDRPCHPGRRRAGAPDPQGRRGPARSPGPGRDREPGRRDPRPVGRCLPPPVAEECLQGADARRRTREAGPGGVGDPPRRQEGDRRLPARRQRERRGTGALPRPAVPPRPHRRGPGDDLRRWRPRPARRLAGRPARHPRPAVPGAQDPQHPEQGPQGRRPRRHERPHRRKARSAARRFADRRETTCPGAVASLRNALDDLLACFRCRTLAARRQVRTTSAGERRFREVRRQTRPMGTFRDKTSTDRIPNAVFIHENRSQGISTPLSMTHDS